MDSKAYRRNTCILILVAATLRAAYSVWGLHLAGTPEIFLTPDSHTYLAVAQSMALGQGFKWGGMPDLNRTPGYPVTLVPGFWIGHVVLWAIAMNIVVSCLCILLMMKMVGQLGGNFSLRLVAGYLFAFEPLSITYAALVLTETTSTAVVLLSLFFMLKLLRSQKASDAIVLGCCIAAEVYIRPFVILLIPALACFLALVSLLKRRMVFVKMAVLVCATSALLITPWLIRNRSLGYTGMSTNPSFTIYFLTAASIVAHNEGRTEVQVQKEWGYFDMADYYKRYPEQIEWPIAKRFDFMHDRAMEIIRNNLWLCAYLQIKGAGVVLFSPGVGEFDTFLRLSNRPGAGKILYRALQAILFLGIVLAVGLAMVGLRMLAGRDLIGTAYIAYLVLFFVVVSGGVAGYSRYRHPCMPALIICAVFGLSRLWPALLACDTRDETVRS